MVYLLTEGYNTMTIIDLEVHVSAGRIVWEQMYSLAVPHLQRHFGDFYHDSLFIDSLSKDLQQDWYYGIGEMGTDIVVNPVFGSTLLETARILQKHGRPYLYHFTLSKPDESGYRRLTIEEVQ